MPDESTQTEINPVSDRALKYQQFLLNTPEYEKVRQRHLKERVFNTFNQFLRFCDRTPLSAGTVLLDIGAADGSFVQLCQEKNLVAQGIDIDDGVDFLKDPLPFESQSVDVITANSIVEHLSSPGNLYAEVQRILRPDGIFLLVTPNWTYSFREFYDDPTHVRPYSVETIVGELKMYGFHDIRVVPWLVNKPVWMWRLPRSFSIARWLPFRGDAPRWIPSLLKGRTKSILAMAALPIQNDSNS